MKAPNIFGERAQARLDELDWSHADLAKELGLSRATVTQTIKRGGLTVGNLLRWAEVLNVTPEWLLGRDAPVAPQAATTEQLKAVLVHAESLGLSEGRIELIRFALEAREAAIRTLVKELPALSP